MKVISFKINDDDYQALKKIVLEHELNFTKLFQPITREIISRELTGNSILSYTFEKNSDLYFYVSQIRDLATKILKSERK